MDKEKKRVSGIAQALFAPLLLLLLFLQQPQCMSHKSNGTRGKQNTSAPWLTQSPSGMNYIAGLGRCTELQIVLQPSSR